MTGQTAKLFVELMGAFSDHFIHELAVFRRKHQWRRMPEIYDEP
jgi:hypothetical protein